jgi:20S proteasome alpha/beta subunit
MTAVIACRAEIDNKIVTCIASDSLFSLGLKKLKIKDPSKIIQFPSFVVGFAGIAAVQTVLFEAVRSPKFMRRTFNRMRNQYDALAFSQEIFRDLHGRMEEAGDTESFSHMGDLVIVTSENIYQIDKYSFTAEIDTFTSIGCAEDLVLGSMETSYEYIKTREDLEKACRRAIEIACDGNAGCQGPIRSMIVD